MADVKELGPVPYLVAADMCRRFAHGPDDTHCLLGWACWVDPERLHDVVGAVARACIKRDGKTIPTSNDMHSLEENAALWNRAMRSLGYTEPAGSMVI